MMAAGAAIWLAVTLASSLNKSASIDEVPHIASGLAVLARGDFRMNPEHPPLMKVLALIPVYLFACPDMAVEIGQLELKPWAQGLQVEYGHYLLFDGGRQADGLGGILFLARIVPALIGLLGGVFAFLWGRELSGRAEGGALAAFFLMCYPEYIGHARFVTLDVPTLVACGAVSWFALCWWRRPGMKTALAFTTAAAIGSQVKLPVTVFTGLMLVTLTGCAAARALCLRRHTAQCAYRGAVGQLSALFLLTAGLWVFAAWAGSGFRFTYLPPGAAPPDHPSEFLPRGGGGGGEPRDAMTRAVDFTWRHRLLPETTLATINHTGSFEGRLKCLMGETSRIGWYRYFFVTFLLKTPLLMTAGMIAAAVGGVRRVMRRRNTRARAWSAARAAILAAPFLALFLIFVKARVNIGHRQALFIYFPLCVMLGAAAARWLARPGPPRLAAIGIIAALIANCAVVFPHYETYFNEIIRKPYRGAVFVLDSNVDWGQDVPSLAKMLERIGAPNVNYAIFGYNRPQSCGIEHFRWVLPHYPYAVFMPEPVEPDFSMPTAVSLNNLPFMRQLYPLFFAREPDFIMNSIVLFLPPAIPNQRYSIQ
ncbi:MAG: hypothetical protein NTY46_06995 [Candidatus Sumerlaeota bacterium]|nr:hypothetical protein [Candidatus Sumerlaeota bacterium]